MKIVKLSILIFYSCMIASGAMASHAPVVHYIETQATPPTTATPTTAKALALPQRHRDIQVLRDAPASNDDRVAIAKTYLQQHAASLHINFPMDALHLQSHKNSLLGEHLLFKPMINGLVVANRELSVSFGQNDQINKVFDNLVGLSPTIVALAQNGNTPPKISKAKAENNVWQHLSTTGHLIDEPKTQLVYYASEQDAGRLVLAYRIEIGVSEPLGFWVYYVDATTGAILEASNTATPHKRATPRDAAANRDSRELSQALQEYQMMQQLQTAKTTPDDAKPSQPKSTVQGTAQVFDPNPRTTLQDDTINDHSPATAFTAAYLTKPLNDITLVGSKYKLEGPWVKIVDFDPPWKKPSYTTNGVWTATRGDNAFNDATTYFQIDQAQRYLQSLGFTGEHGIQYGQIAVDTNGAYGADNSYFIPSKNRLSFGHGGIDDSEDAEVILHEYGHAIQHSINSEWYGGDTGAMGEGFGDYWAASYRYSTTNGPLVHPEWVFVWDGHNQYWDGRVLNAVELQYDSELNYDAHEPLGENGRSTDELWSTPLFQAFLRLRELNIPKSEIDRVILEAHFGLGGRLTMPQMAEAIVKTAKVLYPQGPHAAVFQEKFAQVKIL